EVVDHGKVQAGDAVAGEIDHVAAILKVIAYVGGDIVVVLDHQHAHGISRLTRIRAPLRKLSEKREIALWPPVARSAIRPRYPQFGVGVDQMAATVRARGDEACPCGDGISRNLRAKLEREGLLITPAGRRW